MQRAARHLFVGMKLSGISVSSALLGLALSVPHARRAHIQHAEMPWTCPTRPKRARTMRAFAPPCAVDQKFALPVICVDGRNGRRHGRRKAATDCDDHDPAIIPARRRSATARTTTATGRSTKASTATTMARRRAPRSAKPADCDDKDPAIHPGAAEVCNGKDDNCDGKIDEGFDKDNDGFYACAHGTIPADCDDTDAIIHPGAAETCNGKDDDCNGKIDELPAQPHRLSSPSPIKPHWQLAGSAVPPAAPRYAQLDERRVRPGRRHSGGCAYSLRRVRHEHDVLDPEQADRRGRNDVRAGSRAATLTQVGTGASGSRRRRPGGLLRSPSTRSRTPVSPPSPYLAILKSHRHPRRRCEPMSAIPERS